ncbi:pre-mrna-splicing factor rbm22 [Stylonychia lemnae]|uniref:Pre-mrna-splicing factor rbm22 n=1 Tax=Stylonychia lemnae TaxID=5949 RepID=A0A078BAH4_STYLE|nr:pre-mrna-splicing factor rbm22 [Stylonychia lemnae]|eukprot:CDW90257.1 pre-mrna-splicing factor rbm22 [Stylonychia lemnae]
MTKSEFARECKVCSRPFTVFRWKPGSSGRYKKTEVCCTCAKIKNVCQTCLFDLDFGLPVELRDKFIEQKELVAMPKDQTNRDFWANTMNQNIEKLELPYKNPEVQEALSHVAKNHLPSYKRNQAHVCTFYVRGECNRGVACPYRHTNITDEDLEGMKKGNGSIDQKIRDRFHGVNDPIAKKILDKVKEANLPKPPDDLNITTLFIGGVTDETVDDSTLRKLLEPFGKIKGIKMIHRQGCAFVSFHMRNSAERAIEAIFDRFFINNKRLKVLWAKAQLEAGGDKSKHQHKGGKQNPHHKEQKKANDDELQIEIEEETKDDGEVIQQQTFQDQEYITEQQAQKYQTEQIKKVGITQNEQLRKLMFNYDEEEEDNTNQNDRITAGNMISQQQ